MTLLLLLSACKGMPGYVIPIKKMSNILADMHTAEAVVDMNAGTFNNDSMRMMLKQSVFEKNGITSEQFDTSLVWYAHHMDKYIDLYEETIQLLEKRSAQAGSMAMAASLSMAGDSVDVWGASPYVMLNDRMPSRLVTFDIGADENWEPGDNYTWRVKLIDADGPSVVWNLVANYADSTVEMLNLTTTVSGWNEISFIADSTRQLERLRGSFEARLNNRPALWVDSIQLVRKRVNPEIYRQRNRQRQYREFSSDSEGTAPTTSKANIKPKNEEVTDNQTTQAEDEATKAQAEAAKAQESAAKAKESAAKNREKVEGVKKDLPKPKNDKEVPVKKE